MTTKEERIIAINANIASGRLKITRAHLDRLEVERHRVLDVTDIARPEGLDIVVDTYQSPTSFRLESAGRSMLCMLDRSGHARVDGGDPGDEDSSR